MKKRRSIKNFFQGRSSVRRWFFGGGGQIHFDMTKYNFADAILLSIMKKVLNGLQSTDYFLPEDFDNEKNRKKLNQFKGLFFDNIEKVYSEYINNGAVYIYRDIETEELSFGDEETHTYKIESTSLKVMGKSDVDVLKEDLIHIDNILNAVSTSVKKLGVVTIMTPEAGNELPIDLDEETKKQYEKEISQDYGILSNQSPIKIMSRKFDISTINLAGATLRTNENLQTAVKIVCDTLEVPYEIVSAAIVGNPNQTGVYQEEAEKRLYKTVEKFVKMFVRFAEKNLNLKLDYEISEKPQENEKTKWEVNKLVLETLKQAEEKGYITNEEAKDEFLSFLNI